MSKLCGAFDDLYSRKKLLPASCNRKKAGHQSASTDIKCYPMATINPEAVLCGAALLAKTILKNALCCLLFCYSSLNSHL